MHRVNQRVSAVAALAVAAIATCPAAARAAMLFGDTINGSVRRSTDAAGTNYFAQSSAVVDNTTEFSGIDGEFEIKANVQATDFVNIEVIRIPISPGGTPPNYRFSFSDLDFSPTSVIVSVAKIAGGTPSINLSDVVFGPSSAEFTIGSTFLSNGGSLGVGVRFNAVEFTVPEPSSIGLLAGVSGVLGVWPRLCDRRKRLNRNTAAVNHVDGQATSGEQSHADQCAAFSLRHENVLTRTMPSH